MHRLAFGKGFHAMSDFASALQAALGQHPKQISPKYFYDAKGSALFDRICDLPEYYPTRTEQAILAAHLPAMAECIGAHAQLVEFGAGSLVKIRRLLDALYAAGLAPDAYVPIDISTEHLIRAAEDLKQQYPALAVTPLALDYTQAFSLPVAATSSPARPIGFFPGSTLGNFSKTEAAQFLTQTARSLQGGGLLLGVDLVKDERILHAAYNDAAGVTAAFNMNLLLRANAELGSNFDVNYFEHDAFYNQAEQRIEMHLRSTRAQTVSLLGQAYDFAAGESLHTENSCKYTLEGLHDLALRTGFEPVAHWEDERSWFSVQWWRAK
jgi:L-histidine Nalpha-methyltransferase